MSKRIDKKLSDSFARIVPSALTPESRINICIFFGNKWLDSVNKAFYKSVVILCKAPATLLISPPQAYNGSIQNTIKLGAVGFILTIKGQHTKARLTKIATRGYTEKHKSGNGTDHLVANTFHHKAQRKKTIYPLGFILGYVRVFDDIAQIIIQTIKVERLKVCAGHRQRFRV